MTAHLHIMVPHAACTAGNNENALGLEAPCVHSAVCHRMHRAHSSCAKQVSYDDALCLRSLYVIASQSGLKGSRAANASLALGLIQSAHRGPSKPQAEA